MNIEAALKEAMNIDGALGVSLVDWESGTALSGSRATSAADPATSKREMPTATMSASRR